MGGKGKWDGLLVGGTVVEALPGNSRVMIGAWTESL